MRWPSSPTGMPSEPTVSHTPMQGDAEIRVRVLHAKVHRQLGARRGRIAALAIQLECLLHRLIETLAERKLLRIDDPTVAHEPRETAHRVRATTEAEEIDVVARMVVIDEKSIALLDVSVESLARCTADHAINEASGADTRMVVRELRGSVVRVRLHDLIREPDVRGRGAAHRIRRLRAVPRSVRANDDALVLLANGIRKEGSGADSTAP